MILVLVALVLAAFFVSAGDGMGAAWALGVGFILAVVTVTGRPKRSRRRR